METPLRILILEDQATDAELQIREVKRAGFNPEWRRVETEADFLAELAKAPDLILSDYSLPLFEGLRAVTSVREHRLDTPFILVSGTLDEAATVEAIKFGADGIGDCVRHCSTASRLDQRLQRSGSRDNFPHLSAASGGDVRKEITGNYVHNLVGR